MYDPVENILRQWEAAGGIYAVAAILTRAEIKRNGLDMDKSGNKKGQRPDRNDAPVNPQTEEGGS